MKPVELLLQTEPAPQTERRRGLAWHLRLRDTLSAYLPILLMAALALATWWLVKNSPKAPAEAAARVVSNEPDYTMSGFALERFAADGRLVLRIEGEQMRHYPATDRVEIDRPQITAWSPDGRLTTARAARALGTGDGSEMQLQGGAEVQGVDAAGTALLMQSEFLHVFFLEERITTDRPVLVRHGGAELRSAGLAYAHATQRLDLKGPLRVQLTPLEPPRPGASR
jgi:lipopolysaccharide export system protein LptC